MPNSIDFLSDKSINKHINRANMIILILAFAAASIAGLIMYFTVPYNHPIYSLFNTDKFEDSTYHVLSSSQIYNGYECQLSVISQNISESSASVDIKIINHLSRPCTFENSCFDIYLIDTQSDFSNYSTRCTLKDSKAVTIAPNSESIISIATDDVYQIGENITVSCSLTIPNSSQYVEFLF